MHKKILAVLVGLASVLVMTIFLANLETVGAQECRIIRIHKELGGSGHLIRLEPEVLHISQGTCVIWINWVPSQEIRINFREDGKRCTDATDAPAGFGVVENCYLTDFIPLGGTSSLRFNEEGTFKYEVEIPGERKVEGPLGVSFGPVKATGKIVVQ